MKSKFRNLLESLQDVSLDPDATEDKKNVYACKECGYTLKTPGKLEKDECPECGGKLLLQSNAPKHEDDDSIDDTSDDDDSTDSNEDLSTNESYDQEPSSKLSAYTYQDDNGNIYHSDVEIASYVNPETGKVEKVYSYGKGEGLGKETKQPLAVVSDMHHESAKISNLMRENRRLRQNLKRNLTESSIENSGTTYYPLGSLTQDQVREYASKNKMYTDDYNDEDDYYGEKERFSVSNKDLSIFPLYVLVMDASTKIKRAAKKSNLSSKYELSLNSKNPAKKLIDFVNNEDKLNGSLDSDLNQLKSLVSYSSNDWFVAFGGDSGNESDAKNLSDEIKGMKVESVRLRKLMRENRKLRRSLRSRSLSEASELNNRAYFLKGVTEDEVKELSDDAKKYWMHPVTPTPFGREIFVLIDKDTKDRICPFYYLLSQYSEELKKVVYKSQDDNEIHEFDKAMHSDDDVHLLLDLIDKYNISDIDEDDLDGLKSLLSYKDGDWFVVFSDKSSTQKDASELSSQIINAD